MNWRSILAGTERRTTTCRRCQLEYVPSLGWSRCPGCEALAGRDLRAMVEEALMKMRKDASR